MQTEQLTISDSAWTELLSNGGVVVMSEATGDIRFALGTSTPALNAPAHRVPPRALHALASFGDIPTGTRAFIRSEYGDQMVTVSR